MRYTYAYKTSDGKRHEAEIDAPSREVVFETLRGKGIKAIKVVAADGSKANGEVRGVRKRIVVAIAIIAALVAGVVAYVGGMRSGTSESTIPATATLPFLTDQTRRQVIGDAAVIEKGIRTGWSDAFASEGDRFFASFAIPGVKAGVGTTSVKELEHALNETILPIPGDSLEVQQIKSMVEGMKREARSYIAAGGTVVEYGKRLTERQDAEIAVYKRVEAELVTSQKTMSESAFMSFLEQRNDELRNLGIRPVVLPE